LKDGSMLDATTRATLAADTEALMAAEAVPGASLAIVRDGALVYADGFGYRDLASQAPATADTVFGIGSCGKSFTALAVMQLAERGLCQLDQPVSELLPEFRLPAAWDGTPVTIEQLLSHTSGLPLLPALEWSLGWAEPGAPMNSDDDLLAYIATIEQRPAGRPGQRMSYSNDGFAVAGMLVARLSGLSYADYMTEHVFAPLGMTRSTLADPTTLGWDDVTSLYDYDPQAETPTPVHKPSWPTPTTNGAAGLHRSTANDMARYMLGHLDGLPGVSDAGRAELHRPRIQRDANSGYALGWGVMRDYKGQRLLAHSGGITGVSTHVLLAPERRVGVAALLNISGGPSREIAERALDHLLELPLETPKPSYTPTSTELERAVGRYQYGDELVEIALTDGALTARMGEQPATGLTPTGPGEFGISVQRRSANLTLEPGVGPAPLIALMSRVGWRVE
jgi:CubicO group peptidase (beta-lactamase class C family)